MKVIDLINKDELALSFEFFPPKTPEAEQHLYEVIGELKKFHPDFVSITYGAMGGNREKTFYWAKKIKNEFSIEPIAHLTCIAATKAQIQEQIEELWRLGVINILALRGDKPEGQTDFVPPKDGFRYAKDLVSFIKAANPKICIGAAGYPEKHYESPDIPTDIKYLKEKVDAGAEYIISQLFFDNKYFFDFVERCRKAGINVPIIPGIMPITSVKQIKKMTTICKAKIPGNLLAQLEKYGEDHNAVEKIGIEQSVKQCEELIKANVPGLHFFVMNQSGPISSIVRQLQSRES